MSAPTSQPTERVAALPVHPPGPHRKPLLCRDSLVAGGGGSLGDACCCAIGLCPRTENVQVLMSKSREMSSSRGASAQIAEEDGALHPGGRDMARSTRNDEGPEGRPAGVETLGETRTAVLHGGSRRWPGAVGPKLWQGSPQPRSHTQPEVPAPLGRGAPRLR